jgi:hypothetical protein
MRVSQIDVVPVGEAVQLQALVASDRDPDDDDWFAPFTLWYRFPRWCEPWLSAENGDPFLAALLLSAMRGRERLAIPAPVSPRLLDALPDLQAIYAAFAPRCAPIAVDAGGRDTPLPESSRDPAVGLFFSLGVDSFYSLVKNQRHHPTDDQTVTHLIAVHGFDAAHHGWDEVFPPGLLANVQRVAAETGKTLLPVVTNIRREGARLAPWTMLHGGAMASIALALGSGLRQVTIAASTPCGVPDAWGTHPVLDPLWSTEHLTVVHDGRERDRYDKTQVLAQVDLVLDTLRVCPGYGSDYNCGRCMKCMRTMIDLLQAGALDRCRTLPHEIDPEQLRIALRMPESMVQRRNFRRRLEYFVATGTRPDLQAILSEQQGRHETQPAPGKPSRTRFIRKFWPRP